MSLLVTGADDDLLRRTRGWVRSESDGDGLRVWLLHELFQKGEICNVQTTIDQSSNYRERRAGTE